MLKCLVTPAEGKFVSGITVKRITEATELTLGQREIIKCMASATVHFIRPDGTKVLCADPAVDIPNEIEYRKTLLGIKQPEEAAEEHTEEPEEEAPVEEKPKEKDLLGDSSLTEAERKDVRNDVINSYQRNKNRKNR